MFVCICNAITSKDVEASKRRGAKGERAVFRDKGVLPQCGECIFEMRRLLSEAPESDEACSAPLATALRAEANA